MNTKAKGARLERKSRDLLIKDGYAVTKSGGSLGMFDLIGMLIPKNNYGGHSWRLVQVKANRISEQERDKIKAFSVPLFTVKEIHIWKDYAREPEIEIFS